MGNGGFQSFRHISPTPFSFSMNDGIIAHADISHSHVLFESEKINRPSTGNSELKLVKFNIFHLIVVSETFCGLPYK